MISNELLQKILAFREQRDWRQFHSGKNLSMALCIEGAELMEIFQWSGEQDISTILNDRRNDIENEIADIAIILSYFCHDLGIDLEKSIETKLLENSRKYPIEKARGKSTKYDRL